MPIHSSFTPVPVIGIDRGGKRRYEPQAKRKLIEACLEPGVSLAGLALAHDVNANLLRKWVVKHQLKLEGNAIIRRSLRLKDLAEDIDELPELVVTELSQDEIAELRRQPDADAELALDVTEPTEDDNNIVEELLI